MHPRQLLSITIQKSNYKTPLILLTGCFETLNLKAVNLLKAKAQSIILEPDEPIHQQVTTLTSTSDTSSSESCTFEEPEIADISSSTSVEIFPLSTSEKNSCTAVRS